LSQRLVGHASGLSHSTVSRIENAIMPNASVSELARIGAVVGLQVSLRAYPAGDALRDAGHTRLLARLRTIVSGSLSWQTEVPLPIPGDRRAWDVLIRGLTFRIGVEAETRIVDAQAVARKVALKRRDGNVDHVLLVLAETRANRAHSGALLLALGDDYRMDSRAILEALRRGANPGGSGIVML
jgi:transcriptional regulator with XRE-family HTH domain